MKQIGDLLRTYIERSDYTIYGIAKASGVNRSTLQKILLENRKPSKTLIDSLMPFLKLSPEEQSELLSIVEIMNTGEGLYHQRLYIRHMLEHTSDILCSSYVSAGPPRREVPDAPPGQAPCFFHGQPSIENLIALWMREECIQGHPRIRINLPGNSRLWHHPLLHLIQGCPDCRKLELQHLTPFFKINSSNKLATENLEILHHVIPFIANRELDYKVYYYYNDTCFPTQSTLTAFPYYITGTDWNILLSSDYTTALFSSSYDTSLYLNELFDSELLHARPLAAVCSNLEDFLPVLIETNHPASRYAVLEFQPCLAAYITEDLTRRYLHKDLENREQLAKQALLRFCQLRSFKLCTSVFSKEGLKSFADTGCLSYLPPEYASPFSLEDRIHILRQFYLDVEEETWTYAMIDSQAFSVPDTFSFSTEENQGLTFIGFDRSSGHHHYIQIEEQTLIQAFYDFIHHLAQTPYIASKEKTLDFILECIRSLQRIQEQIQEQRTDICQSPHRNEENG